MSNRYSERATEPDLDQDVDDESEAREEESDPLDNFDYVGSRHHY